jgi:Acyl-CoA reductase (LuxC)
MSNFKVPLIIRGKVIEDYEVTHVDRSAGGRSFVTPNPQKYINQIVSESPAILSDLYAIRFDDIVDFLVELGTRLNLDRNPYWQEAFEASCHSSNVSRSVLEFVYRTSPAMFEAKHVREIAEARIGISYLEGWVPTELNDGRTIQVRAVGSRAAHVIAGNVPAIAAQTLLRSAITRGDSIVKLPSNDPLTMVAIARTMIDIDPSHPLTRHLTVAYWKGGDEAIEQKIYQPRHIEKLIAWGGLASVKHIAKYIQPGIDLITLDPKSSITLIGGEALADDATMRVVAQRAATDIGSFDQEACSNARVIFLESGTDADGIARANRFGQHLFEAVQKLPKNVSAGPNKFNPVLKAEIQAILRQHSFYKVITDAERIEKTGAVIVSQLDEKVDFVQLLSGRVSNIVPIDDMNDALPMLNTSTQTVGVFPETLLTELRDHAAIMGAQRIVSLGYAQRGSMAGPHDGLELERRMCRWVVSLSSDPALVPGAWMDDKEAAEVRQSSKRLLTEQTA